MVYFDDVKDKVLKLSRMPIVHKKKLEYFQLADDLGDKTENELLQDSYKNRMH